MHNFAARPIKVHLSSSLWLAGYVLLAHLFALGLILLAVPQMYLLVFLVVLSLIYYWRKELLHLGPKSVTSIDWSIDRGWRLRLKDGSKLKGSLCPTSLISRYILILHFKTTDNDRHKVAITKDAVDYNQFRRLTVLLKMQNHFGM